jgi:hypothetical protein
MKNLNHFYALLMGCPFNQPFHECAIEKYRKMSLLDLIDSLRLLGSQDLSALYDEHAICAKSRLDQKVAS